MQKGKIKAVLAILATLFSFSFLILLIFYPIPQDNKDLINIAIGVIIGAGFGSVFTYYFGSSEGSSHKNEIIEKIIREEQ